MSTSTLLPILVLITVGLNTLAQMLLKLGSGQSPLNVYLAGGLLAYAASTVFYIAVLGKSNLSLVYPVVIGLTVAATTLTGAFLLREKVAIGQWVGIGLMLSGISAIALAKTS
jgi:small multidrug resistance pump